MIYKSEPYAFYGKSTDTKPTPEEFPSLFDDNLVLFYELDTGNIKYYNTDSSQWGEYPTDSGGGGGGVTPTPSVLNAIYCDDPPAIIGNAEEFYELTDSDEVISTAFEKYVNDKVPFIIRVEDEEDWEIPYSSNCYLDSYNHYFSTSVNVSFNMSNDGYSNLYKTFYISYDYFGYNPTYKILKYTNESALLNSSLILESQSSSPTANDTYYYDGEEIDNEALRDYFPYISYISYNVSSGTLYVKPIGLTYQNGVADFIFADATYNSSPGA